MPICLDFTASDLLHSEILMGRTLKFTFLQVRTRVMARRVSVHHHGDYYYHLAVFFIDSSFFFHLDFFFFVASPFLPFRHALVVLVCLCSIGSASGNEHFAPRCGRALYLDWCGSLFSLSPLLRRPGWGGVGLAAGEVTRKK